MGKPSGSSDYLPEPTLPDVDTGFLDDEAVFADDLNDLLRASPVTKEQVSFGTNLRANAPPLPSNSNNTNNNSTKQVDQDGKLQLVSLGRKKTLTRPSRRTSEADDVFGSLARKSLRRGGGKKGTPADVIKANTWVYASWVLTCCIPRLFIEKVLKKGDPLVQQAYREKVALCVIIFVMMGIVGFLTFGFQNVVCPTARDPTIHLPYSELRPRTDSNNIAIHGVLYTTSSADHVTFYGAKIKEVVQQGNGGDFGLMFPPARGKGNCAAFDFAVYPLFPCTAVIPFTGAVLWPNQTIVATFTNTTLQQNPTGPGICHKPTSDLSSMVKWQGDVIANYTEVARMAKAGKKIMIISGNVLDISPFFAPKL
ncbi:hypothetical protein BDR26DRAFT_937289 [Obelidium mucronatum]|nr:hypothetical protein BDR26DRAFT_937289 [Obelidium mucronatum]